MKTVHLARVKVREFNLIHHVTTMYHIFILLTNESSAVLPRNRKLRSHSSGAHGRPPQQPQTIIIKSGSIKHKEAKKTLLAIIRLHWPVGAYSYTEIERITNKKFTENVLDEFHV